jgi:ABC-type glycerol-3-phosphate transport system substrate-binding protein
MSASKRLSRRQFLALSSTTVAAGALLAACGGAATQAPAATAAPSSGDQTSPTSAPAAAAGGAISFLCRADIKSAYAADKAVEAWNKENAASQIKLDEPPAGDITTKIQASQAAGDLVWDGFSVMEAPWSTVEWTKRGIIQPLDDFIAASKVKNADKVKPGIIPTILESASYNGKQYLIPGNVGTVALAWFTQPLKDAGYTKQPETWDEVYDFATKSKAKSPKLTPFDSAATPLCDLVAMMWGGTDTPYDKDGLLDITGQTAIDALKWLQKMVKEGLMPKTHTESLGNWLKGGTAMITSYDVAGTMAQQTFGDTAADTGINYFKEKGKIGAGAPFWINGSVLLNKAKNPQGMVDFFLWWFGPDNKTTGKQIADVAAKPCYQYTYDEFVKPVPKNQWQLVGIDLVSKSKWFPINTAWGIENTKLTPWVEKVVDPATAMDPAQAMAGALKDIQTELAKQKFG